MTTRSTTARRLPAVAALTLALCAGCASGDGTEQQPAESKSSASAPHGYVEGAEESAEQQSRLVLGDPATGRTRVLDLIDEKTHRTPSVKKPTALTTDGRFAHFHTATGATVLDTGAWMVDHGDHVHYYRADIRPVGRISAADDLAIRSDAAVTAVTGKDGGARLHRRADLEDGRIGKGRDAAIDKPVSVIPFDEHLVVVSDDGESGRVTVRTRAGKQVAAPKAGCRDPRGDAVTRRGVVLSCADGAVLVREEDGKFEAVEIPYPEDTPEEERADDFRLRPGSDTLTSLAGDAAVWVLDVTDRKWKRIDTGPVVAANTAGEGAPLLALGPDGTLRGYDIDNGRRTAEIELKAKATGRGKGKDAGTPGAPDIAVDTTRAYVSDPAGKRVDEIDYNDDLRLARSFDLDISPGLMVETGR
ncbi:hypothetical protein DSC45_05355 [Streptomyces sp. YIM 130001]|uniref:hypothetical protein n=1 Tax=Streptomyces sp. YIM 130001 TaxID=2259644 RepID=UPI000E65A284|nr:hypothetical protein [Streptomyces sp. YIM 130001]RII20634.1 hypothetical protein DSC45_05355 [Streptomyces sp. YIM 130001]